MTVDFRRIDHARLFHLADTGLYIRDGKLMRGLQWVHPHHIQALPDYTGPRCGVTACPTCDPKGVVP